MRRSRQPVRRRLGGYRLKVLALFGAASLAPALVLSATLGSIAEASARRSLDERGGAAALSFGKKARALEEALARGLEELGEAPQTADFFEGPSAEAAAAAQRLLARAAEASPGLEFALAAADGRVLSTADPPWESDFPVYRNWGVLRDAADSPSNAAVLARRRVDGTGRVYHLVGARLAAPRAESSRKDGALAEGGRATRGTPSGGAILGEISREAYLQASAGERELLGAEVELVEPSGLLVFSYGLPDREGLPLDQVPRAAAAGARGPYRAAAGSLEALVLLPGTFVEDLRQAMRAASVLGLGLAALLASASALVASRVVTGPVLALAASMRRVRAGELDLQVDIRGEDELGELARAFNDMTAELRGLVAAEVERAELLRKAELRALAARMNPHFLRNALNSIKSLAKLGRGAEAAETAARLGKLLGTGAGDLARLSTLGAELELARHYLYVERARFGDRLRTEEAVDESLLDLALPSLVLEPLVENALIHGLEAARGPWSLRIEARREGDEALLAVEDDGPGMEPEALERLAALLRGGEAPEGEAGLGLAATNRRLRLHYGPRAGIRVGLGRGPGRGAGAAAASARPGAAVPRRGFRAELRIPLAGEGGSDA